MKKIIILLILLLSIFMISAASASNDINDNVSGDVITDKISHTNNIIDKKSISTDTLSKKENTRSISLKQKSSTTNDILTKTDDKKLKTTRTVTGNTFTDIGQTIAKSNNGDIIRLNGTYTGTDFISISKSITIEGNNAILNGLAKTKAFSIESNNVTLKNIIFTNFYSKTSGGAIAWDGDNGKLTNCEFNNCTTEAYGAIYWGGKNGTINNCEFNNCESIENHIGVSINGGAIYWCGDKGTVSNSKFNNCTAYDDGGAIAWTGDYGTISNSEFNKCYSHYGGGAIYWNGDKGTVSNSKFNNCTAGLDGGVIKWTGDYGKLTNCKFNNCTAITGGVIYVGAGSSYINICNSDFTKNNSNTAIFLSNGDTASIHNCIFFENEVYCESGSVDLSDCIFNPVKITAPAITTTYNENKYLLITLKDNNDKFLTGVQITVDLNGAKTYTTDTNGQVKISTKGLVPKTYKVIITFNGNKNYTKSSTTTQITVNKATTKLTTASKVTTTYNINKNLVITLKDNQNKPLTGIQITVKLGTATKKYKTNKKGQIQISTKKLTPKTYTTKISFTGNNKYTKSSTTTKIIIKKATPKLTAKAKTLNKSLKIKKYNIALRNNINQAIKTATVIINVNGKKYKAQTNKKGVATFKINKLNKKGKYPATITYNGNKNYNKLTKKVKITVK